jgi:hypothetical protein
MSVCLSNCDWGELKWHTLLMMMMALMFIINITIGCVFSVVYMYGYVYKGRKKDVFSLSLACSFVKWMKWPMGNWKQMVNDEQILKRKKKWWLHHGCSWESYFLTQLVAIGVPIIISRTYWLFILNILLNIIYIIFLLYQLFEYTKCEINLFDFSFIKKYVIWLWTQLVHIIKLRIWFNLKQLVIVYEKKNIRLKTKTRSKMVNDFFLLSLFFQMKRTDALLISIKIIRCMYDTGQCYFLLFSWGTRCMCQCLDSIHDGRPLAVFSNHTYNSCCAQ